MLAGATLGALGQTNAPEVRRLSLEDCLQSALHKNLDLQIARYIPPLALSDLQAAYAGYNPSFTAGGGHNYSKTAGGFNPETGTLEAGTTSDGNSFNSSLGGLTPWGLNYSLAGNVSEAYGTAAGLPFDQSRGQAGITLSQPLLKDFWIDKTRLNIRVKKIAVKYSELTLKQQIMKTATTVENAYYDLIYYGEKVTVQEKAVELARQLVAENKKRVEVGALAPLDQQNAEAQAASTEAALMHQKAA